MGPDEKGLCFVGSWPEGTLKEQFKPVEIPKRASNLKAAQAHDYQATETAELDHGITDPLNTTATEQDAKIVGISVNTQQGPHQQGILITGIFV